MSNAGTIPYCAPEIFQLHKGTSRRSDIWAAGVTLYQLLTDKMPYKHPSAMNERTPPCPSPSSINPDADARLDAVIVRALRYHHDERYQDAAEMLADLEAWTPASAAGHKSTSGSGNTFKEKSLREEIPTSRAQSEGLRLEEEALELACNGQLDLAADRMEEAIAKWPQLRDEYGIEVQAWRNGITTR
jgi:serine/threonine protein kinase